MKSIFLVFFISFFCGNKTQHLEGFVEKCIINKESTSMNTFFFKKCDTENQFEWYDEYLQETYYELNFKEDYQILRYPKAKKKYPEILDCNVLGDFYIVVLETDSKKNIFMYVLLEEDRVANFMYFYGGGNRLKGLFGAC